MHSNFQFEIIARIKPLDSALNAALLAGKMVAVTKLPLRTALNAVLVIANQEFVFVTVICSSQSKDTDVSKFSESFETWKTNQNFNSSDISSRRRNFDRF